MVKIRLKQVGRKKQKKYRIVVMESRQKRDGKELEILGYYDPMPDLSSVEINLENFERWLKDGAVMTERVKKLYDLVKNNKLK